MDVRELRIGNLVMEPYDSTLEVIDSITFTEINRESPDYLKSIPLTGEWLARLGFELKSKYSFHNYMNEHGFVVSMWMEDKPVSGFEEKGICYWGEHYTPIRYVHSLQNLHYCITGREIHIQC